MAAQLTQRSVTLMVAGALLLGWLGVSLTQSPAPAQAGQADRGPRPLGSSPATIVQQADRLRQHMAQPPQPSRGRNPFIYGPRVSIRRSPSSYREAPAADAAPPVPLMPVEPPLPPMPVFKLSGIASNVEGGAPVLTAIMNDNGAMVFAKAGDKLSHGYAIVRVDETSVTLVDAQGITQTIRLP